MDIATIIGLVLSAVLIAVAIVLGGSPGMFFNAPSILIVVGGTIGATLVKNPLAVVLQTFKIAGKAFSAKLPTPPELVEEIVELAREARKKKDILALENVEIRYGFLAKGVQMLVDGIEFEKIRATMENELRSTINRHKVGREILEGMGQAAPAFGMIGTLIGLVQMLASMEDPSSIGPAMAVALLTTLYGALLANVIFLPLAVKLKVRSQEELQLMMMCLDGIEGLAAADNPRAVEQRLYAFVPPKLRNNVEEEKAA